MQAMLAAVTAHVSPDKLAVHFHNTYAQVGAVERVPAQS